MSGVVDGAYGAATVPGEPDGGLLPRLEALARRAAATEGVEVAHLELKRQSGGLLLRIYIDRPDASGTTAAAEPSGVSLGDCQRVSERLSVLLDVEDPIDTSYTLEVSSPGLDRPLWSEADYVRFQGRAARLETAEPIEGRRRFRGRLAGVQAGSVLLDADRRRLAIPFGRIREGRLEVELSRGPRARRRS